MAKPKGCIKTGGRQKGTLNKERLPVEAIAAKYKLQPFDVLMMIINDDFSALGYENSVYVKESASGESTTIGYVLTPEMRLRAATEANKYLYAQRKAVELSTGDEGFKIEIVDYTSPVKK